MRTTLIGMGLGFVTIASPEARAADEVAKLIASDGSAFDQFGISVAVSGAVAVVGAQHDDDNGSDSGSAYVYRYDGSQWNQEQKLTASDGANGDDFGYAVALFGDVVIVSAHQDDDRGSNSGSAYVFRFDGTQWNEEQKLTASDGASEDVFGVSVSVSCDVAVVGAYFDDDFGTSSGSAYVFRFNGTLWVQEAKLTASNAASGDFFGSSVAASGDVALVGAQRSDAKGFDSGSAYAFRYNGTNWVQEQQLTASDGAIGDFFGYVAVDQDVAVIGANLDDDNGSDSGSAYVYRYNGTNWIEEDKLTASNGATDASFGYSVAVSDDLVVVGAYLDHGAGLNSANAYVYRFNGTQWTEMPMLTPSDGASGASLGQSVAVSGETVFVGAFLDDDNGADSGSAYVFRVVSASWTNYGTGFPGTNGVPTLTLQNNPVIGTTITVDLGNSANHPTVAFLFVGTQRANYGTKWGGSLLVDSIFATVDLTLGVGITPLDADIPNDPTICGVIIDAQFWQLDLGAPPKHISCSPGIELVLGY